MSYIGMFLCPPVFLVGCGPVSFPSEMHLSTSDTDPDRAERCYHGYQKLGGGTSSPMLPVHPIAPPA